MALRTLSGYRFEVNDKLALRIAIAGVESFAITGAALDQMARLALRAGNSGFIGFINELGMLTFWIVAAADKHTKTPLAQHQFAAAVRAMFPLQNFDDMSIR